METLARAEQHSRSAAAAEQLSDLIAHSQVLQQQTLAVLATLGGPAEAALRAELARANLRVEEIMLALERAIELTRSTPLPAATASSRVRVDSLVVSATYVGSGLDPVGIIVSSR